MTQATAELLTLLSDPARLDCVPQDAIPVLIGATAELQARLYARLHAGTTAAVPAPARNGAAEPDRLLSAKEAAPLLGVKPRWLYRHADTLPFTRRLTGGTVRFSARGLERWKEGRKA